MAFLETDIGFFPVTALAGHASFQTLVDLSGTLQSNIVIDGQPLATDDLGEISGEIKLSDSYQPYFGIGWGNVAEGKKIGFLFDIGVLKQGSGRVSLESDGTASGLQTFIDDLDEEAREIEDDISDYDFWPVVSAGVSIRF